MEYPGGPAGLHGDVLRHLRGIYEAIGLLASNKVMLEDDFTGAALDAVRWTEEAAVGAGIAGAFDAPLNFYQIEGTAVGGAASDSIAMAVAKVPDWRQPFLLRWTQRLGGTPDALGGIRFYCELTDGTTTFRVGARKLGPAPSPDDTLYVKNGAAAEVALDTTNNTAAHQYMLLCIPGAPGSFQDLLIFEDGDFKTSQTVNFASALTIRWVGSCDAAADVMTADQNYVTNVLLTAYDATILSDILAALGGTTGVAEGGTATTLIDAHLTQADDYWNGQCLVMRTGNNAGLSRRIVDFDNATDTITVDPAFPGLIAAGAEYTIKDPTNAPTADSTVATTIEASIGNKADAAVYVIAATSSLIAYGKGILGKVGAAYLNAGGNPDVDTVRAHLRGGLLNGTGTVVPANKGLYDLIGADYVDLGGNPDVDNIRNHLVAGLLAGTGTALPANTSLFDVIGAAFVDAGGNPDVNNVRAMLRAYAGNGAATALQAAKSIVDAVGHDGTNHLNTGVDADTQYLSRTDPGAGVAGSITARIGQTNDAGVDPDGGAGSLHGKVSGLGARVGDAADTQANSTILGRIAVPTADVATNVHARDVIGNKADAAVAAPSATASIVAYLKGILNSVGTGVAGTADAGSDTDTLIDADRTEAAADYWVGALLVMEGGNNVGLARVVVDFNPATDALQVAPAFPNAIAAGDAYNLIPRDAFPALTVGLNATGVSPTTNSLVDQLFIAAGEQLRTFIAKTGGTAVPAAKSLYNILGTPYVAAGGNPDVDTINAHLSLLAKGTGTGVPANKTLYDLLGTGYIAGGGLSTVDSLRVHLLNGLLQAGGTSLPAAKALYDLLGTGFVAAGGNPDVDTLRAVFRAYLGNGAAAALAAGKSLVDAMGHDGTINNNVGLTALLNNCWRRQAVTTFNAINVGSGATQNMLAIGAVAGTIGYRLDGGFVNVSALGSNTIITITVKVEINGVETTFDTVVKGATGIVSLVGLLGGISSRRILITVTGNNAANDGTVSASFETSLAGV